jgi:hypothetical protein
MFLWKAARPEQIKVVPSNPAPNLRLPAHGSRQDSANPLTNSNVLRFVSSRGKQAQARMA